ncbi:senecionine N-oxygenase-like [Schistocerca americana]|uniref:senecionine N-oxygenase-like n=1 Tax=Schistocerca americana TaxID=7009 RepID=UPI001F4FAFBB|nr:senecionine N-oxygenase-like [Schistocerca americana]
MSDVAVLGAGISGLATARRLNDAGYQVTVFERSDKLGGTWAYTPSTWLDDDGRPVYTSMYENLVTNLPKQLMTFPDFPFHDVDDSYVRSEEILKYINSFADKFGIRKLIKFQQHVEKVSPRGSRWAVEVTDLRTRELHTYEFDSVAVCTGQFWCPKYPAVEGRDLFRGRQTHSHEYRRPEPFKGRRVLVVGGGPSGFDLALNISAVAEQVIISYHPETAQKGQFPDNVIEKPTLVSLSEYAATFEDGTSAEIDDVCYCTGYRYRFPFLTPECGVTVEDKHVRPLYHQVVHIDRPTMAFIGVPYYACPCMLFDAQAQFWVAVLDGRCRLPDPATMRLQELEDVERRRSQGVLPHNMATFQREYVDRLAELSGASLTPRYYHNMFDAVGFEFLKDLQNYRKNKYRIVDDENYEKVL